MAKIAQRTSVSARDILPVVRQNLREPFYEILALCIGATPTQKRLMEFADEYPDRWATMMSTVARLAGYSEKIEHAHNHQHMHVIADMSDSQLRALYEKISNGQSDPSIWAEMDAQASSREPLLLAAPPEPMVNPSPARPRRPGIIRITDKRRT